MNKLTILVDMDDVLNDLIDRWVEELNKRYGTTVHRNEVDRWDIASLFPSLTKEQVFAPVQNEVGFWWSLAPTKGSVGTLRRLADEGHTIKIVTASYYKTVPPKIGWILMHYPFFNWNDVIIAHDKKMIRGDVMIDDGVHNLEGGEYEKILFTQPHNVSYDAEVNGMYRAKNWDDVYKILINLSLKAQR